MHPTIFVFQLGHLKAGFLHKRYQEARSAHASWFAFDIALHLDEALKQHPAGKVGLCRLLLDRNHHHSHRCRYHDQVTDPHNQNRHRCKPLQYIFFKINFSINFSIKNIFCLRNTMSGIIQMDGSRTEDDVSKDREVSYDLLPTKKEKILRAMKAPRFVKRMTFNPSEASPGDTLLVQVPKLNQNEVIVQNSLALIFDIDLSGGHANNFLVQNVSRALVEKLVLKFAADVVDEIVGYDIYKTFQNLFLPGEKRDNMVPEGIQSEDLYKIRSNSGDKKTSGVDTENKLKEVYGSKYRINLDHQILTDHGVFYPQALYDTLVFKLALAPASQVVRGSDTTKLKYKLKNIQLEYEMV